ncbi:hypothetical protein B0H12DRAFT_1107120 [Mycena haematopus]|nr:hypothetical protein B0H12DRAFT_1107120 [Mycena haematopus]
MILLDEPFPSFFDFTDFGIDSEMLHVSPDAKPEQAPLMNSEDKLFTGLAEEAPLVNRWPVNTMFDFKFPDFTPQDQQHPFEFPTTPDSVVGYDHLQTSLLYEDSDGEDQSIDFLPPTRLTLGLDSADSLLSRSPSPVHVPGAEYGSPSAPSLSSISATSQEIYRKTKWTLGAFMDYDASEISSYPDNHVVQRCQIGDTGELSGESCQYKARALHTYRSLATNSDDISFRRDEILEIVEKHDGWCRAKKADGSVGMAPCDCLLIIPPESVAGGSGGDDRGGYRYKAMTRWACTCSSALLKYRLTPLANLASQNDPNEISFCKSEILDIVDWWDGWCQAKKADGSVGIAPSNCLLGVISM